MEYSKVSYYIPANVIHHIETDQLSANNEIIIKVMKVEKKYRKEKECLTMKAV